MTSPRLLTAMLAAGFALAPAAHASDATDAILAECARTGTVAPGHQQADLRDALANLPADVAEYTDCPNQIAAAMRGAALKLSQQASTSDLSGSAAAGAGAPADGTGSASDAGPAGEVDGERAESATTPEADGTRALPNDGPASSAENDRPQAEAAPYAQPAGSIAAAAVVGFSLLALARPGMLGRRPDEEE